MPTSTTSNFLDGPGLVEWLREQGSLKDGEQHLHGKTIAKRLQEWKAGGRATVWTADKVLIEYGHHLTELPDDLYTDPPR